MDEEKPNLRPTKRSTAHGKSLYLHYNPYKLDNRSSIYAISNDANAQPTESPLDKQDPFGIQQPHVHYSLNKQHRWELLDDFREHLALRSSSSSDDELHTQSDSEQRRNSKKSSQKDSRESPTTYRLREYYNTNRRRNCVAVTTNAEQQGVQTPGKNEKAETKGSRAANDPNTEDNEDRIYRSTPVDVTYITIVPPPRENYLDEIRRNHSRKSRKVRSGAQGVKATQTGRRDGTLEQLEDEDEELSTDDDDLHYYTTVKHDKLKLNDFIPTDPAADVRKVSTMSKDAHSDESKFSKSEKKIFYRQMSKEAPLRAGLTNTHPKPPQASKPANYLMSLSFRMVHLHQSDLTVDHLSRTYGKNFILTACYPTKYVIRLTDWFKSFLLTTDPEHSLLSQALDCYLVIVLNEQITPQENICQAQVAVNMDLNVETIEIESLCSSNETIYQLEDLIGKTLKFIARVPPRSFKPIDFDVYRRRFVKNETDSELSDSEFVNKQIRQVRTLAKNKQQSEKFYIEPTVDESQPSRPEICTSCYSDMNDSTAMTALTSCAHWLCNDCWKHYLQTSVKQNKVVLCPEWNCSSIIDVGTMLSLVNVRCVNIYERNIERCLVNLSRSYVTCPVKACASIVQIIGSRIDNVRCRCGHQFCPECKQEPHFPATCSSYEAYVEEARRNGDFISKGENKVLVRGRNCVSCNNFIEKNGGCDHMTCRCGAEFCWLCTGYWADHFKGGNRACPKPEIKLQQKVIVKERNAGRKLYEYAIFHRYERAYENQAKLMESCKRLIGTIPLDKQSPFDTAHITSQIAKREALLRHCFEMVKYISHLHRICEFIAVAGDGYANNPIQFASSLTPLATIIFNLKEILESGRGYKAIEQLNSLHQASERIIERLRQARQSNPTGYSTS